MSLVGPRPHATAHNEQYRGLIRRKTLWVVWRQPEAY